MFLLGVNFALHLYAGNTVRLASNNMYPVSFTQTKYIFDIKDRIYIWTTL